MKPQVKNVFLLIENENFQEVFKIWGNSKFRKLEWLELESFQVKILSNKIFNDSEKVELLKVGIDSFTHRGYFGN
jgi:hypothetical protein